MLRPPTQFVVNRLMPGELGLELTTLIAVGRSGRVLLHRVRRALRPQLHAHSARQRLARPGRPVAQRHARGRGEGGHQPRRAADRDRAGGGHEHPAHRAPALPRGARAGDRARAHLHRSARDQGGDRPAAAHRLARGDGGRRVSERSRRIRDGVGGRRGGAHTPLAAGDERRARVRRACDCRGGRRDARLPARALVVGRRAAAGGSGPPCSRCSGRSPWSSSTFATMETR